jgi:hypothetical protein
MPVGIGELMLSGWLLYAAAHLKKPVNWRLSSPALVTALFIVVAATTLCLGYLVARWSNVSSDLAVHSAFGLGLVGAIGLALSLQRDVDGIMKGLAASIAMLALVLFSGAFLAAELAYWIQGSHVIFYYEGVRYAALSKNPNQYALYVLFIPYFTLALVENASTKWRILWYVLLFVTMLSGLADRSDALLLGLIISATLLSLISWGPGSRWLGHPQSRPVLAVLLLAIATWFGGRWILERAAAHSTNPAPVATSQVGNPQTIASATGASVPSPGDSTRQAEGSDAGRTGSMARGKSNSSNVGPKSSEGAKAARTPKAGTDIADAAQEKHLEEPKRYAHDYDQPEVQSARRNAYDSLDTHLKKDSVRMALWKHGLGAISKSPIVGFGPGHFSGLDSSFQNDEAHNTLIDWGTDTGIVGVAALIAWLAVIIRQSWRIGSGVALAGILAAIAFSQFHFVLRQPIFLIGLLVLAMTPFKGSRSKSAIITTA